MFQDCVITHASGNSVCNLKPCHFLTCVFFPAASVASTASLLDFELITQTGSAFSYHVSFLMFFVNNMIPVFITNQL